MGAAEGDKEREIVRGRQGTVARIDQFTKLYAKRTCKSSNNKNKNTQRQQRAYSLQQKTTTVVAAETAAEVAAAAALATAHKKKQFVTNGGERQNASKNRAQERGRAQCYESVYTDKESNKRVSPCHSFRHRNTVNGNMKRGTRNEHLSSTVHFAAFS